MCSVDKTKPNHSLLAAQLESGLKILVVVRYAFDFIHMTLYKSGVVVENPQSNWTFYSFLLILFAG